MSYGYHADPEETEVNGTYWPFSRGSDSGRGNRKCKKQLSTES